MKYLTNLLKINSCCRDTGDALIIINLQYDTDNQCITVFNGFFDLNWLITLSIYF